MLAIALLPAGSLAVLGKEALPHVNNPPVHLIACVHALCCKLEVRFIQSPYLGTVPGSRISLGTFLHVFIVGVDDGRGEFNQGVLLCAALDPVVSTDVNKLVAGHARNLERFYIIDGVHRSELVVGAIDKPGKTLARPHGQAVVVDEDVMAHAQLGDGNLLIIPGVTAGELEVEADHLALVLSKNCSIVWMELSSETGLLVYTTERSFPLTWVSTT